MTETRTTLDGGHVPDLAPGATPAKYNTSFRSRGRMMTSSQMPLTAGEPGHRWWILAVLATAQLMVALDATGCDRAWLSWAGVPRSDIRPRGVTTDRHTQPARSFVERSIMKAAQFSRCGGPEVLQIVDLPDPHPGPGQVRIVVHAAGISATDPKLRAGTLRFGAQLPQTTGRDVAGVVDEIGEGVTDVAVGDRVFGVSDDGAGAAELALLTFRAIIPRSLGFVDAAGLPVALETGTRAIDQLGVNSGGTLFINGASGGIGSTVVQLAAARGARVIGAATTRTTSACWARSP